jgi:hypothetical protein
MRNTLAAVAALVALGLAASAVPAMARHSGGISKHHAHFPIARHHRFLSRFAVGFGLPYWGDYGPYDSSGYASGYAYDESPPGYGNIPLPGPRWDYQNHSLAIEHGSYTTGQPSATITQITPQEGSERDRAWIKRCEPRLAFERDGVEHYFYNGKPGCASGQWAD